MATISSTWKPENDLLFCDVHNLVMKMHGQVMCGAGFLTSYDYAMAQTSIDIESGTGGIVNTVPVYNSHLDLNIGIRLYQDTSISNTPPNLTELLTSKLSEFELIKEVNRRFKKEQSK